MIRKRPKIKTTRIDYAAIAAAGGIAKGPSVQLEKGWKDAQFIKDLAAAYLKVNRRDDNRSRVSGRVLLPRSGNDKDRREHNHLENRATAPSKITDAANIFLVSTYEHGFITRNELLIHGTNANRKLLFYWNPNIFTGNKPVPFRIPAANLWKAAA